MIGSQASGRALAGAGWPGSGGGRVDHRVALRVVSFAIALAGAWAGWTLLSAPRLQVTPEAAHVWMLALDDRIRKRAQASYEGPEVLRFHQRVAGPGTAEGAGPGAHRIQQVRGVLLEPAALRYQQKLLQDIAVLIVALDECGELHCREVDAYVAMLGAVREHSTDAVWRSTAQPDWGGPHGHEVCHIQDVHAYRDTLWDIVGIHADLSSRYYHQHRAVAVLQLLQRRLF